MQLSRTILLAPALALGLLLGGPTPASALSLADLAGGASFDSSDGGLTFSGFHVKIKGGNKDLAAYEVTPIAGGFSVDLSGADDHKSKISLQYEVAGDDILGAALELSGLPGKSKAKKDVKDGKHKVAKLKVDVGELDSGSFDPAALLGVKEKVQLKPNGSLPDSFTNTFLLSGASATPGTVPEAETPLLLLPGLLLLAGRRIRRRRA